MPKVSGFETLSAEHRAWLLSQWRRTGYGDNARLAVALAERLAGDPDTALEPPDATTVWRWARGEKARGAKIRYAAELRAATIAALPEDDPGLADRVGAYMEGRMVEAIEDLDGLDDLDPLARIDTLTKLTQANTNRRRVATDRDRAALDRERAEVDRARLDIARAQAALSREKWEAEQAARREEREKAAGAAEGAARSQGVSAEGIAALRAAIMGAL